jgi:uncharacterized membrane protein
MRRIRNGRALERSHQRMVWVIAGFLIVVGVALFILDAALAGAPRFGWGMMPNGGWGFGWFAAAGALVMLGALLIVILLVLGFWRLLAQHAPYPHPSPSGEDPLTVLKRRYASGEISKEQFDQIARDLGTAR